LAAWQIGNPSAEFETETHDDDYDDRDDRDNRDNRNEQDGLNA
jgi:hypothetical protein